MLLISKISTDPFQTQTLLLEDGTAVLMTLYYSPQQYGWFFWELTWKTWTVRGLRVCNSPNILHQWKNIIPFGLGCFTEQNREPTQLEDFATGAAKLYILTQAETAEYTEFLNDS